MAELQGPLRKAIRAVEYIRGVQQVHSDLRGERDSSGVLHVKDGLTIFMKAKNLVGIRQVQDKVLRRLQPHMAGAKPEIERLSRVEYDLSRTHPH